MIRRLLIAPEDTILPEAIRLELADEGITLYQEYLNQGAWMEDYGDETCPIHITIPRRHLSEFVTLVAELMSEVNDPA